MLHTYYYVNGNRVSSERYLQAVENNQYNRKVFERAVDYFKRHQMEWEMISLSTTEEMLPTVMATYYELNTEEGRAFSRKWREEAPKRERRAYLFIALIWITFFAFIVWGLFYMGK